MKFTEKDRKRIDLFTEKTLERFESKQSGPWLRVRGGRGFDRPISARGATAGEGQGAREHEGLEAHLLVCLKGWIGDWRGLAGEEQ